jgi:hypothetical protein
MDDLAQAVNDRRYRLATLMMAISFLVAACGKSAGGLGPWQEDVQLSDGRVIVVERFENIEVRQPIGDVGSAAINSTTIKFVSPPDLATLPSLSVQYRPIVLDYDQKLQTWFIIGVNERMCLIDARKKGQMDSTGSVNIHPNFEFRIVGNRWREVEIGPDRIGMAANLLLNRTTVDHFMKLGTPVPLESKRSLDDSPGIVRELKRVTANVACY